MSKTNKNILIIAIAGLAILIAAYANHFDNGFHFDDSHAVVNNVFIRNIKNIPTFLSTQKCSAPIPRIGDYVHWLPPHLLLITGLVVASIRSISNWIPSSGTSHYVFACISCINAS